MCFISLFFFVLIEDDSTPNVDLDDNGDNHESIEQNYQQNVTGSTKENTIDNDGENQERLGNAAEWTEQSQVEMVNNIEEHQGEQVADAKEDTLTIVSNILEDLITQITETEKKRKRKKKKHIEPRMGMGHFLQYLKEGDGDEDNSVSKTQDDNSVNTNMVTDMDAEVCFFPSLFLFLFVFSCLLI